VKHPIFRSVLQLLLLLALPAAVAAAERVYWEPGAGSLAFNQVSPLQLVFENCAPESDPKLPAVPGLELQYTGTGSSFSMENMSVTRRQIFNFAARPTRRPEVRIPPFDVETDKGTQHVAAATFAIGNATVGQSAIPLDTAVVARLSPAEGSYWAGEVFPVSYALDLARRFRPRPPGPVVWKSAPLSVEDWGQPEQFESTSGGEPRIGLTYKTRGYLATPGSYKIPPATQEVVLMVDTSGSMFSFPFSSPEMIQHTVTSNEPALTIRPLPDGAPADFGGAVGRFTLTSKVVPTTVAVGEPVTWTLDLGGTGNWPDLHGLPAREVSKDFKVLQPQAKRTPAEGKLFEATLAEDIVLIPTKPGTYTLGPVSYSYFDPSSGTYKTVETVRATVVITPPGAAETGNRPLFTSPSTAPSTAAPATAIAHTPQLAAAPGAPAAIPRDPLPGAGAGLVPLRDPTWYLSLLASFAWLAPAWIVLAVLRSRQTDPSRASREARLRLGQTLADLRNATDATSRVRLLHAWQRDTAALLGIVHAAPTSAIVAGLTQRSEARRQSPGTPIPNSDRGTPNPGHRTLNTDSWAALWAEADRALYGESHVLPEKWVARAEAAIEATPVPRWPLWSLFEPRNLLPWIAAPENRTRRPETGRLYTAILLLVLLGGLRHRVSAATTEESRAPDAATRPLGTFQSPLAAYSAGDFSAAEQGWRAVLARKPSDWVARHNLGLALAQQGHWPEAAAQWTSAFLLNPRNESVRWHLMLGYERAEYTPPGLGEFVQASGPHLVARLASPAEWQWLVVVAGLLFAVGLWLILLRLYRGVANGWTRPVASTAIAVAGLLLLCAVASLHFYGDATDPRAAIAWHQVLLRSIPTEADTQQKTSSLPAGSLGIVDKDFLGWVRLAFPNGQTGWVRQEDIVWLYR
jgi:tetratricopeptide (TPR) repeat protein